MCGIAGLMSTDNAAPAMTVLDAMADALAHRGPDGHGTYAHADVAMVQTRLAIIDLHTGDQPLFAPAHGAMDYNNDAELALVANGEIYNYVELRAARPGIDFRTASDCETALYLYREQGIDFAEHLRGMYAIAIHDPVEQTLTLARDPFGIKPLYYGLTEDGFAFASEAQALLKAGLALPKISPTKRDELLALQFTTAPKPCSTDLPRAARRNIGGEGRAHRQPQDHRRATAGATEKRNRSRGTPPFR